MALEAECGEGDDFVGEVNPEAMRVPSVFID